MEDSALNTAYNLRHRAKRKFKRCGPSAPYKTFVAAEENENQSSSIMSVQSPLFSGTIPITSIFSSDNSRNFPSIESAPNIKKHFSVGAVGVFNSSLETPNNSLPP